MRYILLLILSAGGDVEPTQIEMESLAKCLNARTKILEEVAEAENSELKIHGAYCIETRG